MVSLISLLHLDLFRNTWPSRGSKQSIRYDQPILFPNVCIVKRPIGCFTPPRHHWKILNLWLPCHGSKRPLPDLGSKMAGSLQEPVVHNALYTFIYDFSLCSLCGISYLLSSHTSSSSVNNTYKFNLTNVTEVTRTFGHFWLRIL